MSTFIYWLLFISILLECFKGIFDEDGQNGCFAIFVGFAFLITFMLYVPYPERTKVEKVIIEGREFHQGGTLNFDENIFGKDLR